MARIDSPFADSHPSSFSHARRPALIPSNCSLSPAESKEIARTGIQQPLFPTPESHLFQDHRTSSPTPLISWQYESTRSLRDCSFPFIYKGPAYIHGTKSATSRDPRRRTAHLKARAKYVRDRKLQQFWSPEQDTTHLITEDILQHASTNGAVIAPKPEKPKQANSRKHSAFVIDELIDEELISQLEARADTPHISELEPSEEVSTQESGMSGEIVTLDEGGNVIRHSLDNSTTATPNEKAESV